MEVEVGSAAKTASWAWWHVANLAGAEVALLRPSALKWLEEYDWQKDAV